MYIVLINKQKLNVHAVELLKKKKKFLPRYETKNSRSFQFNLRSVSPIDFLDRSSNITVIDL